MKSVFILAASLFGGVLAGVAHADDFPPGGAHDLVAKACTACHVATQVTSQHKTADQWGETVNQMISNGAQVDDKDFDKVVDYLAKNFGPETGAPPPQ